MPGASSGPDWATWATTVPTISRASGVAGRRGVHGGDQLLRCGPLEKKAARPGPKGVEDVVVVPEGGQHEDAWCVRLGGAPTSAPLGYLNVTERVEVGRSEASRSIRSRHRTTRLRPSTSSVD